MVFYLENDAQIPRLLQAARDPSSYRDRLAHLYLISDVAVNAHHHLPHLIPLIETNLSAVVQSWSQFYQSIEGRLRSEQVKRHLFNVLDYWEEMQIFSTIFVETLKLLFIEPEGADLVNSDLDGTPLPAEVYNAHKHRFPFLEE